MCVVGYATFLTGGVIFLIKLRHFDKLSRVYVNMVLQGSTSFFLVKFISYN